MQKKGFLLIVLLIIAAFLAIGYFVKNMTNQFSGPPSLAVSEEIGDLGKIKPDEEKTHVFTLENKGGETLMIERVQATCGCTATMLSEEQILPGKTGQLEVTFNPRGYEGLVTKSIYIYSNDPEKERVKITIQADVEHVPSPEIHLSEQLWDLSLLTRGDSSHFTLEIVNQGDLSLDIESIDVPDHIQYNKETLIFPRKLAPEEKMEIPFTYDSSEQETGLVREHIRLVTNDPNHKNITLRIEGYIGEKEQVVSIRPVPEMMITENPQQGAHEAKFLLKNNSGEILQIVSVQSSVAYLRPISEPMSLSPGEEREMIIQIDEEKINELNLNEEVQEYIHLNIALPVRINPEHQ